MNGSYGLQQFLMQRTFQQVPPSASFDCSLHLGVPGIGSQHDDPRFRSFVANRDQRVQPAHYWHLEVHQRNVRMVCAKLLDRFTSIRCFAYNAHVHLTSDEISNTLTDNWMVVGHQNPNRTRLVAHDFFTVPRPDSFSKNFSISDIFCPSVAVAYARAAGMLSSTSVPASSSLHTVSLPPMSLALSRMPRKPKCPWRPSSRSSFGSMPLPSSRTRTRSRRSS